MELKVGGGSHEGQQKDQWITGSCAVKELLGIKFEGVSRKDSNGG
jgi:hypothetical protein